MLELVAGSDRFERVHTGLAIHFDLIDLGGNLEVDVTPVPPTPPPSGFQPFSDYQNARTDAQYSGDVTVCLAYDDATLPAGTDEDVIWLHRLLDDGSWQPAAARTVDAGSGEVCGVFPGLSWFGLTIGTAGDLDGDGDVDRDDLDVLLADRGLAVADSACGSPCDLDDDGEITGLDSRKLTLLCTRAGCATRSPTACGRGHGVAWILPAIMGLRLAVRRKRR